MEHCTDNTADRAIGKTWERNFCKLAWERGFMFSPMQIGRVGSAVAYQNHNRTWKPLTLPDVTVWTAPGQHHEIKHKNPTKHGSFGLEKYRLDALLAFAHETEQDVMYTIHNHDLAGGRDAQINEIGHWFTVNVLALDKTWAAKSRGYSWVNGQKKEVAICYWPTDMWAGLAEYWQHLGDE